MTTQPPARDPVDEYVQALMARCRPLETWQRDAIAALLRPARRPVRPQPAAPRRVVQPATSRSGEGTWHDSTS